MDENIAMEIIMLTRRSRGADGEKLIYTEEVITKMFCKLAPEVSLKVCDCDDSILDESD